MSARLPHFFRRAINDKLRELVMRLLVEPTPLPLLDVYLKAALARAERSNDKRDYLIRVMDV
jgi:hypothetical protein